MKKLKLTPMIVVGLSIVLMTKAAWADDNAQLKQQVQELQERVNQLQAQLSNGQQGVPAPVYDQYEDPFTQMMLMQRQMERNMRQAFDDTGIINTRMDMQQTDKAYIVTVDLPGMDKDKIDIQAKDGVLTISGERKSETQNNNQANQYYTQERSFGSFMQAVPLPDDAKKDQINASYKNGVLTVTIPRMTNEEKKHQAQKIAIQ